MTTTHQATVRSDGDASIGYRIVREVARREGAHPLDLEEPLSQVVDVDALEALLAGADAGIEVTFTYLGHRVTARGDGTVLVEE